MPKKIWYATIYKFKDGSVAIKFNKNSPSQLSEGEIMEILSGEDLDELKKRAKQYVKEVLGKDI